LLSGIVASGVEVRDLISFSATRKNFLNASQYGLDAQLTWLDGKTRPARELVRKVLLPLARTGLEASGIDSADIDLYMGTIDARTRTGRTGAFWMLESLSKMDPEANSAERMRALTGAMMDREKAGLPVHKWKLATTKEAGSWSQNFFTVDQFMTTDLVTVHEDELIDLCASLMRWRKIDQVPVEDDDQRLVGLVAVSEVLKLVEVGLPEGEGLHVSAQSVMDPNPVTIPADTRTLDAIELMREKQLECLLVVDGDRLVGMLTEYDLGNIARQLLTERLQAGD
jgi:CBS domain-containing protein